MPALPALSEEVGLLTLTIRPWTPTDLPDLAEFAAADKSQVNLDELAQMEAARSPEFPFLCLVAEQDGKAVGWAFGGRRPWTDKGDLNCSVLVAPACRQQGIGTALYDALTPFFREHQPRHLRANGDDHQPAALAWAERRGFKPIHHIVSMATDLAAFDPAAYAEAVARVEAGGIRFVQFGQVRTPETEARLHALYMQLDADTPEATADSYQPFDQWRAWALASPEAWPEGWTVAVAADGDWVGFTLLQKWAPDSQNCHIYMTGVKREYRNRSIALALKATAARYAKAQGMVRISTITDFENLPMRAVNTRLGYQTVSGFFRLLKDLGGDKDLGRA
ncbi:MAG TPA: GNAT family N-acetyltransferase [Symbiobacteriaceae bacterium]|jgi:GNAT superfamily N-acetyltransferase